MERYSHSDFKRVFKDLFKLIRAAEHIQEENKSLPFFIVYDKELLAGRDWETTAGTLITNSNCNGVIFYISERSLNSNAIHKEIEYVKKSGNNLSDLFYMGTYKEWKKIRVGKGLFNEDAKRALLNEHVYFDRKLRVFVIQSNKQKQIKEVNLHCADVTVKLYIDLGRRIGRRIIFD